MASVESLSGAATKSLIDIDMALANLQTEVIEEIRVLQDDSQRYSSWLKDIDQRLFFLEYSCKINSTDFFSLNDKVETILHQN